MITDQGSDRRSGAVLLQVQPLPGLEVESWELSTPVLMQRGPPPSPRKTMLVQHGWLSCDNGETGPPPRWHLCLSLLDDCRLLP